MVITFQYMSDLHLDFQKDGGASCVKSIEPLSDIIVLAGDIDGHKNIIKTLKHFASLWKHVIFVPGNHEYYGSSIAHLKPIFESSIREQNLHILMNNVVEIEGQRFVGTTLWFEKTVNAILRHKQFSDFKYIEKAKEDIFKEFDQAKHFLSQNIQEGDVVVTHHIPSPSLTADKYKLHAGNCFYASDLDNIIMKTNPKVWVFGHTHELIDKTLGDTRFVCNPLGYEWEGFSFSHERIIRI